MQFQHDTTRPSRRRHRRLVFRGSEKSRNISGRDFMIGTIIGALMSYSGFMTWLAWAFGDSSLALVPWGLAITAALLILGIYLWKGRGKHMVLHGMAISLVCGLCFFGKIFGV